MNTKKREKRILEFLNAVSDGRKMRREMLAADASFRHYERIWFDSKSLVLMDAPPPKEDVRPFCRVCDYLRAHQFSAPEIIAADIPAGLLLLEDYGDNRFTHYLQKNPRDIKKLYRLAVDLLVALHRTPPLAEKNYSVNVIKNELSLFTAWYAPLVQGNGKLPAWQAEYDAIWNKLLSENPPPCNVTVLRDYHADNLMWLSERHGYEKVGLLDFQDALQGSAAYDLVSLLEDARRDTSVPLQKEMLTYYIQKSGSDEEGFMKHYALLGAQRNLKILGIFARLMLRDGKSDYLQYMPRVWKHLTQDIKHPLLAPLKILLDNVFAANVRETVPKISGMKKALFS